MCVPGSGDQSGSGRMRRTRAYPEGQILIMAIFMILVLTAIAMFTVDVGYAFTHQAMMQNASDAAALAALQVLAAERKGGATETEARCAAASEAAAIAEANAPGTAVQVQFGIVTADGTFTEQDDSVTATAARAVVTRGPDAPAGALPLFFGALFGCDALNVSTSAVAGLATQICGVRINLVPFAVYEDLVANVGEIVTFYGSGEDSSDMDDLDEDNWTLTAPGCFGLLNLDGGSFSTQEMKDWILNGYSAEFKIDPAAGYLWVDGGTGFRSSIRSAIQSRIGDKILVAVYDQVTGTGSNAEFRIVSFAAFTITQCHLTGNNKYIKGRIESLTVTSDLIAGGNGPMSSNLAKTQLVG